jgi:hypothetical protein
MVKDFGRSFNNVTGEPASVAQVRGLEGKLMMNTIDSAMDGADVGDKAVFAY